MNISKKEICSLKYIFLKLVNEFEQDQGAPHIEAFTDIIAKLEKPSATSRMLSAYEQNPPLSGLFESILKHGSDSHELAFKDLAKVMEPKPKLEPFTQEDVDLLTLTYRNLKKMIPLGFKYKTLLRFNEIISKVRPLRENEGGHFTKLEFRSLRAVMFALTNEKREIIDSKMLAELGNVINRITSIIEPPCNTVTCRNKQDEIHLQEMYDTRLKNGMAKNSINGIKFRSLIQSINA